MQKLQKLNRKKITLFHLSVVPSGAYSRLNLFHLHSQNEKELEANHFWANCIEKDHQRLVRWGSLQIDRQGQKEAGFHVCVEWRVGWQLGKWTAKGDSLIQKLRCWNCLLRSRKRQPGCHRRCEKRQFNSKNLASDSVWGGGRESVQKVV